jgi:hypothetical protein
MAGFFDRLAPLREAWTRAAKSPLAQQMHATLTQDLPSWLLELSTLSPVEIGDIAKGLTAELGTLAQVCAAEQKTLSQRGARSELALRLSLARVTGVLVPLEAMLTTYTIALRRSDPRLAAIAAKHSGYGQAAPATVPLLNGAPSQLSANDCRRQAEALRTALGDVVAGAQRIERDLRGARSMEASAVAGAIAQAQVLVDWLRQAQQACAGQAPVPLPVVAR